MPLISPMLASSQLPTISAQDSPVTTPLANAPDLSTRAESEPETQVVDQSPDVTEDDDKLVEPVAGEGNSQEVAIGEKANPAESVLACMVEKTRIDLGNESTCTQSTAILNTTGVELTQRTRKRSVDEECDYEIRSFEHCLTRLTTRRGLSIGMSRAPIKQIPENLL